MRLYQNSYHISSRILKYQLHENIKYHYRQHRYIAINDKQQDLK